MNKILKRSSYALAALGLIATNALSVTNVFADDIDVCSSELTVDTCRATDVDSFNAGVDNLKVWYIVLDADIAMPGAITIDRSLSFDLNGYALGSDQAKTFLFVEDGATVTIDDTSESMSGQLYNRKNSNGNVVQVVEGSELRLKGGTITTTSTGEMYGVSLFGGSNIVMEGGAIDTSSGNAAAVASNGTENSDANIYIYSGELTSKWQAIYMPNQTELLITGDAEVNGGIFVRMGQVNINGDAVINAISTSNESGTDSIKDYYSQSNGYSWLPDAIVALVGNGAYKGTNGDNSLNITISENATINVNNSLGHAFALYEVGNAEQDITVTVEGGTFVAADQEAFVSQNLEDILGDNYSSRKSGFGEVENTPVITISGGDFSTTPDDSYIADGHTIYDFSTDEAGSYVVASSNIDVEASEDDDMETTSDQQAVEDSINAKLAALLDTLGTEDAPETDDYGNVVYDGLYINLDDLKEALLSGTTIYTEYVQYTYAEDPDEDAGEVELDYLNDYLELIAEYYPDEYTEFAALLGDATIAGGFEGNIYIGGIGYAYELDDEITLSYEIPEDLQETPDGYTREFKIIRIHYNRETSELEIDELDTTREDNTLYTSSDKFSTFVVAYADTADETEETKDDEDETSNPVTFDGGKLAFATIAGSSIVTTLWGITLAVKRH